IHPLRDRGSDILELADRKLVATCQRIGTEPKTFSADAIQAITTYPWPGNVRELENALERAVILCEDDVIPIELLGLDVELVKIEATNPDITLSNKTSTNSGSIDDDPLEDLSLEDYFQRFVLEHQD